MKNILEHPTIKEIMDITSLMYQLGWNERNGGNISILLDEEELKDYIDTNDVKREIPIQFDASNLAGKIFLVTGTGSYFRNIKKDPENLLGIIKINPSGNKVSLLWGYKNNGQFTSELPTHLMVHAARLKIQPSHRVVMHCHPTNIIVLTHNPNLTEKAISVALWKTMTESIVVFPEGVGYLPWMLSGTNSIGVATSQKIMEFRLVLWGMHGIYGVGETIDDAFGLIETADKATSIYLKNTENNVKQQMSKDNLLQIAKHYKVKNVNYKFLEDE